MDKNITFDDLRKQGINVDEGFSYTGNPEKYLAALQRFYRRSEETLSKIKAAADKEDCEELTILVHALKSNAKALGDDRLSAIAAKMEEYGQLDESVLMLRMTDDLIEEFDDFVGIIKPYGEMEQVHPDSEISAAQAEEAGKKLIGALEEFDDEEALKQLDILIRYPFRFTLINVLKTARSDITDFEYNEALLKVRRVVSQIED